MKFWIAALLLALTGHVASSQTNSCDMTGAEKNGAMVWTCENYDCSNDDCWQADGPGGVGTICHCGANPLDITCCKLVVPESPAYFPDSVGRCDIPECSPNPERECLMWELVYIFEQLGKPQTWTALCMIDPAPDFEDQ